MKVLWFTASPSLAGEYLNNKIVGRSWIESLEREITKVKDIQLGIAFICDDHTIEPFELNNAFYYPVIKKKIKGKIKKVYAKWLHEITWEEYIPEYIKVIEKFKPDVIHIFGLENDFGLLVSKIDVPCVIHIQGSLTIVIHKWYSGITKTEVFKYSSKWKLLKGQGLFHDHLHCSKEAVRERTIFQKAKFFMGRTDWDSRITSVLSPIAKYFHCDEIMREKFYINQWQPHSTQDSYTIVSTIRKNIYKGLETVYECKKILNQAFSKYNITWKVAGTGKDDEICYLIERKYKEKFNDIGIKLLGPLQEGDLVNEMLTSDLFINPSHVENSSNSICEAMLLGMPVIATYAGGTPSLIENKMEGLLVQDGDPYALGGAIIELIEDRNYASGLGINARKKAVVRHDPTKIVKELLNIYSSIIGTK